MKHLKTILSTTLVCAIVFGGLYYVSFQKMKENLLTDVAVMIEENKQKTQATQAAYTMPSLGELYALVKENSLSTVEVAAKVSPSVVQIITYVEQSSFNIFSGFSSAPKMTEYGSGSGIIISKDGYIVTNNHVIADADRINITLASGDEYEASLVGTDAKTDLAVLKIEGNDLPAAELGDSSSLAVGEPAIAIGNPLGQQFSGSVTAGIISSLNRKITIDGTTYNLIQTDAAINSGNSGGALVNSRGQIIGINSVKISASGVEGLGFAIPIDDAKPIIEDLLTHGYVRGRPSIGVELAELSPMIARYYQLPLSYGLYVNAVTDNSGAKKAGLLPGDIITAAEGTEVISVAELNAIRDTKKVGETLSLSVYRDKKTITIPVTLTETVPGTVN
ncbi:MAG: trypsin-like peptidase domain-containing protein [Clostridia bacterium]|nr:trypsin-like peptidase domain-containing protein [Clostridia bacterium]